MRDPRQIARRHQTAIMVRACVLTLFLFACAAPSGLVRAEAQESEQQNSAAAATAQQIIHELAAGQFDKVEARYDARMASALPTGKLAASWPSLVEQEGAFQSITNTHTSKIQGLDVVKMECKFQNAIVDATVALDPNGKIAGLGFRPHQQAPPPWIPPTYAKESSFTELPLTLENGKYKLPGKLPSPKAMDHSLRSYWCTARARTTRTKPLARINHSRTSRGAWPAAGLPFIATPSVRSNMDCRAPMIR